MSYVCITKSQLGGSSFVQSFSHLFFIKEWYPAGLRTRIMPNGAIVIINTRYHYDDLCGWLLKQQENMSEFETIPWEVIKIPAWVDEDAAELLDLPVGSSYFPEWKTDEVLRTDENEIKASNGSRYRS